jgi:O-antigen/teichoic acid export membrane protein
MVKVFRAFYLGVLSFVVFMFLGETADNIFGDIAATIATFVLMAAYFFICQFLLSRGNPHAFRKDWPIMLVLNATIIVVLFVSVLVEKQGAVFLIQILGILLACFAGTFAGAFAASLAARRRARRQ